MAFLNKHRIAAALAFIISLLAISSGGRVLLGLMQPNYHILPPLVVYNVLMAFVGLVDGWALWSTRLWSKKLTFYILLTHIVVLVILITMRILGGQVANQSLGAMAFRVMVWSTILWLVGKNKNLAAS